MALERGGLPVVLSPIPAMERTVMRALFLIVLSVFVPRGVNAQARVRVWTWTDATGRRHGVGDLRRVLRDHAEWLRSGGKRGVKADFSHAILHGADFRHQNLSAANFEGADLTGADLSGARFGPGPGWAPSPPEALGVRITEVPGGRPTTYFDLLSYFFQNLPGLPAQNVCSYSPPSGLPGVTDMKWAVLRNANLTHVELLGTALDHADLRGAKIDDSDLNRVDLDYANLSDASVMHSMVASGRLFDADLAGATLSSSRFLVSDMRFADLADARLDGTDFRDTVLCNANFEPAVLGRDARSMASARGLPYLTVGNEPDALTSLRDQFRKAGFERQEREVTFALRWHQATDYWQACSSGQASGCLAFVGNEVFFDWTCRYGLEPGRALLLLLDLWAVCAGAYWLVLMVCPTDGALYVVPSRIITGWAFPHPKLQRIGRRPGRALVRNCDAFSGGIRGCVRLVVQSGRAWLGLACHCAWTALWFSTVTAFNIGFRDVAAGRWLRLLTSREYEVRARGWVRVLSGVQSLCSMALLALWLLTYFGRPFG